jgi:hypothetical protein
MRTQSNPIQERQEHADQIGLEASARHEELPRLPPWASTLALGLQPDTQAPRRQNRPRPPQRHQPRVDHLRPQPRKTHQRLQRTVQQLRLLRPPGPPRQLDRRALGGIRPHHRLAHRQWLHHCDGGGTGSGAVGGSGNTPRGVQAACSKPGKNPRLSRHRAPANPIAWRGTLRRFPLLPKRAFNHTTTARNNGNPRSDFPTSDWTRWR